MTSSTIDPLLVDGEALVGLVPVARAVAAVEQVYRDLGAGRASNVLCHRLTTGDGVRVCAHQGTAPHAGGAGVFVHAEQIISDVGEERLGTLGPPVSLVYDPETASLRGIVIGEPSATELPHNRAIAGLRTAATSVVGTLALARDDAETLAIIGAGSQAEIHTIALQEVRPFVRVVVASRSEARRDAFVDRMRARSVPIRAVSDVADAVAHADVILTATNARSPVIAGERLRPGQHVTSIVGGIVGPSDGGVRGVTRGELDLAADRRAAVVAMASLEQAYHGFEPIRSSSLPHAWQQIQAAYPYWDKCVDLADLLAGTVSGRAGADDITVFKNNAGQGMADMAIAGVTLDLAAQHGLGRPLLGPGARGVDRA
jgi:ornithine cyclodeaminase/alanine dehydrogenase-like protein (mu-crystallin family)